MSSFTGHGDGRSQQGYERMTDIGNAFMKRMALRVRRGIATPEALTSSQASIREGPANELFVDVEKREELCTEADALSSLFTKAHESTIPRPLQQIDKIAVSMPITYMRGVERQERTRRLLAKYGLSIDAQDWMSSNPNAPPTVLRVEKKIRMRVRYSCHMCERLFGVQGNCKTCNHKRCDQCLRHPSRRNKIKDDGDKENLEHGTDILTLKKRGHEKAQRNMHLRGEGKRQNGSGEPIPVTQLFQHECHKCTMTFEAKSRLCRSCGHLRCARCPLKLRNWNQSGSEEEKLRPERVYRQPRQRIRWICDHCQSTFTEGNRVCAECLHKRCDACQRIPPKRGKLDHDENKAIVQNRVRAPGFS